MPSPTGRRRRGKRSALWTWVPTALVALLCVAVVVMVFAVQNSWWAETNPRASTDQRASDGMSLFTTDGVDYFTKQGIMRMRIGADSLPATELGLDADGEKHIEPLVPVMVVVLGDDGVISLDLVRSFTITSENDEVTAIDIDPEITRTWASVSGTLAGLAPSWGWSQAQLDQLDEDLGAASEGETSYSAELPAVPYHGAFVSAEVVVDTANPGVGLTLTISADDGS